MRITGFQMDIEWSSPSRNIKTVERMLSTSEKSDLYIMPEMWSTGFAIDPRGIAESDGGTLQWMRKASRQTGAAFCGSLSIEEGGTYRNRHYFILPDGTYRWYDKRHLFRPGHEDRYYTQGDTRTIVEWCGVRMMLQTCYDLRFPTWSRYRGDYDAIVYVANWPANRIEVWDTLLRARAIENQCYVVGVNRVGRDPYSTYDGHSALIGPKGEVLSRSESSFEDKISGTIDTDALQRFREKFRVLDDRD